MPIKLQHSSALKKILLEMCHERWEVFRNRVLVHCYRGPGNGRDLGLGPGQRQRFNFGERYGHFAGPFRGHSQFASVFEGGISYWNLRHSELAGLFS